MWAHNASALATVECAIELAGFGVALTEYATNIISKPKVGAISWHQATSHCKQIFCPSIFQFQGFNRMRRWISTLLFSCFDHVAHQQSKLMPTTCQQYPCLIEQCKHFLLLLRICILPSVNTFWEPSQRWFVFPIIVTVRVTLWFLLVDAVSRGLKDPVDWTYGLYLILEIVHISRVDPVIGSYCLGVQSNIDISEHIPHVAKEVVAVYWDK